MRPDELGILFLAVANVEQNLSCIKETIDFIKLIEASTHQFVGFGHFKLIFQDNANYILSRANELFDIFCESYPQAVTFMTSILDSHKVAPESPIGIAVKKKLLLIETYSIFSIRPLIESYKEWISKEEINPLPLLLSPDQLFSPYNPNIILSPLPAYNDCNSSPAPPTIESIEEIPPNTHQSLLYHALLHAKQRKTTLATDEMTRCCLKMTEDQDASCLPRSAIALAQIFDLLGMKEESILALNESIGGAKSLPDSSVISAAVALKAKIDASDSAYRYAAEMKEPHPKAIIRVALDNGNFAKALTTDPLIAANVYAEKSSEMASVLPLTDRLLPTRVLHMVQEGNWHEAALLIKQMDMSSIEIRATALAFAVSYFAVHDCDIVSKIYRYELNDVMSIDLGHFSDLKRTIQQIADVYSTIIRAEMDEKKTPDSQGKTKKVDELSEEILRIQQIFDNDSPPLDQPRLIRIHWMAKRNNSVEVDKKLLELCYQCGDVKLFNAVQKRLTEKGVVFSEEDPYPAPSNETLDIDAFLHSFE